MRLYDEHVKGKTTAPHFKGIISTHLPSTMIQNALRV